MSGLKAEHEARVGILCARDLFQRAHQTVFLALLGTLFLGWLYRTKSLGGNRVEVA